MSRFVIILSSLALLLAALPARAETNTYKGRTITMPDGGRNELFDEYIHKAIDLVDGLPAKYKTLGNLVKDLRYEPIPSGATGTTAHDNIVGVYVVESKDAVKGHIRFPRNPAYLMPASFALSLVGNGIYYQWHSKYVEARRQQNKEEAAYYEAILAPKDLKMRIKAECEIMGTHIGVMKALDMDPKRIDATVKERNNRGC